jgi:hypothetical protein
MGHQYDAYQKIKRALRANPSATDEELAAVAGLKLAFPEELATLTAAKADFEADRASLMRDLGRQ